MSRFIVLLFISQAAYCYAVMGFSSQSRTAIADVADGNCILSRVYHKVLMPEGIVFDKHGKPEPSSLQLWNPLPKENSSHPKHFKLYSDFLIELPVKKISVPVLVLPAMTPDNYYHWSIDVLGRLILNIKKVEEWFHKHPEGKLLLGARGSDSQLESLIELGINPEQILWSTATAQWILSPHIEFLKPDHAPGFAKRKTLESIREHFFESAAKDIDVIFVSRYDAYSRRILNEMELVRKLQKKLNVKYVSNSQTLSSREQAKLFSPAKVVISSHGAGLTNMLFMQKSGTVIELFPREVFNNCYRRAAFEIGLNYHAVHAVMPSEENYNFRLSPLQEVYIFRLLRQVLKKDYLSSRKYL